MDDPTLQEDPELIEANGFVLNDRLLSQVTEYALDAFIVTDHSGRIVVWNRQAEKMFGWSRKEALGKLLANLVVPDRFREIHLAGFANLRKSGKSKILNQRLTVTGKRKLGPEFAAEITIQAHSHGVDQFFSAYVRDIEEQRTLIAKLGESEERFRGLVERTPVGIYIHRDLKPLYVNQAFCTMLGYVSPADFLERIPSMEQTFAPYEVGRIREIARNRLHGEEAPGEYEYDCLCRDGSVRTLRNNALMITWDGETAVQCAVTDITEVGRSSAALRLVNVIAGSLVETRERGAAIDAVLGAICRYTGWAYGEAWLPDGSGSKLKRSSVWTRSDAALNHFAEESAKLVLKRGEGLPGRVWERHLPEWISDIDAIDKLWFFRKEEAAIAGLRAACAVPVLDERRLALVLCFFDKERRAMDPQWLEALVSSVAPLGIYLRHFTDEEQLKRYEEIIAGTPEQISFVDDHFRFQAISTAFAREFNSRREDIIGRRMPDVYGQGYFEHVQKPRVSRCLKGQELRHRSWYEFPRSGRMYLDVLYTPYRTTSGRITGVLITARDLTETHIAEEKIRRSRKQLRELAARLEDVREQERTQLAQEVHDNLGQKLAVLRMDLEMLAQSSANADDPQMTSTKRPIELVDELLSDVRNLYSRLRPAVLDELGIEDATNWLVHDFAKRTGWSVEVDMNLREADLGKKIRTPIFRVLQEALTNVARHAKASRVKVTLCIRHERVFLEVLDDGRGIALDKVNAPGSIGIAGMRERAAVLGGRLQLIRNLDAGTRARLWVPLKRGENDST